MSRIYNKKTISREVKLRTIKTILISKRLTQSQEVIPMYDSKTAKRARLVLEIANRMAETIDKENNSHNVSNHIVDIQLHYSGYGERGCYSTDCIIATGNWNAIDTYDKVSQTRKVISNLPKRLMKLFEKLGIECEWSDEWVECSQCGKLVRTIGDSYSWKASYALLNECEVYCAACIQEDPKDYLERLEGNETTANTIIASPEKHGYVKLNNDSFETGWHPGQNDSPETVKKGLQKKGVDKFFFHIDSVGQFDCQWSVFVHESEVHLLQD